MSSESLSDTGRAVFRRLLEERMERALPALLAGRPRIDGILRSELETPGSDQRGGVNLIVRPPAGVLEGASLIQSRLQTLEPAQYYYPADDIHLTLVEICHSRPLSEARLLAGRLAAAMGDLLAEASPFWLGQPLVGFDEGGVALNFMSLDDALQSTRRSIINRFEQLGVDARPRYPAQSAHITLMRYTNPLRSHPADWVRHLQNLSLGSSHRWRADTVWMTHGATWYGMRSRVSIEGPFQLPRRGHVPAGRAAYLKRVVRRRP